MTIAQKVEGGFLNYRHNTDGEAAAGKHAKHVEHKHGRKDEHAWISCCLYPPLPRYDIDASGAPADFITCWKKMDLFHVIGFPMWEQVTHLPRSPHDSPISPVSLRPRPSMTFADLRVVPMGAGRLLDLRKGVARAHWHLPAVRQERGCRIGQRDVGAHDAEDGAHKPRPRLRAV